MKAANTELIFETERLTLRKFRTTDFNNFWDFMRQTKDDPTTAWPVYRTQAKAKAGLIKAARSSFFFAIVLKAQHKVVGAIKLDRYKKEKRSTMRVARGTKEINYILHPDYWRQEIIPEAMRAVVEYAFTVLNVPEIVTCHAEINTKSGEVQENLGFQIAGRIQNYYVWTDGTPSARIQRKLTQDEFYHTYVRTTVRNPRP